MPKLVQINVSLNWGSTGKIAEGIADSAHSCGWECYTVHGQRYKSQSKYPSIQLSNRFTEILHYLESTLFDRQGLGSRLDTVRLIRKLKIINPDIIHLHVIHGSYLNYKLLFKYIKSEHIPIVWTFHDCWAFTGHCVYFDRIHCEKWKSHCCHCPQRNDYPKALCDNSSYNYQLKKALFNSGINMTIVPVSRWLCKLVDDSFLKNYPKRVIHNGIDLKRYTYSGSNVREKYSIRDKHVVLGVANGFGSRKGLNDFISLSHLLPNDFQIVMVGVGNNEVSKIPSNIIAIGRTDNQQELVDLYSVADVFINPTYEDNFPTTNIESLACGTPVITYNTGGSPESIDESTGLVVPQGDVKSLLDSVLEIVKKGKSKYSTRCRERAINLFNQEKQFMEYVELYNRIID